MQTERDRREQCAQKWTAEQPSALFKVVKISEGERSSPTDPESWLSMCVCGGGENWWHLTYFTSGTQCGLLGTVTWQSPDIKYTQSLRDLTCSGLPTAKLFTQRPTHKLFGALFRTAQEPSCPPVTYRINQSRCIQTSQWCSAKKRSQASFAQEHE